MKRWIVVLVAGLGMINGALAQDFVGASSMGSQEPLYRYDDQEKWKHGWMQDMPYYGGHHAFRPYNYHHVFGQSTTAQGWGMSMPYSQQFWHRYENMTNLAMPAQGAAGLQPVPQQQMYPQQFQQGYPQQQYYPQEQYQQQVPQPIYQRQTAPQMMGPAGAWNTPQQLPNIVPQQTVQTGYVQTAYPQPQQQQQMLQYLDGATASGPALPGYAN